MTFVIASGNLVISGLPAAASQADPLRFNMTPGVVGRVRGRRVDRPGRRHGCDQRHRQHSYDRGCEHDCRPDERDWSNRCEWPYRRNGCRIDIAEHRFCGDLQHHQHGEYGLACCSMNDFNTAINSAAGLTAENLVCALILPSVCTSEKIFIHVGTPPGGATAWTYTIRTGTQYSVGRYGDCLQPHRRRDNLQCHRQHRDSSRCSGRTHDGALRYAA